jgi:hypothetical protein
MLLPKHYCRCGALEKLCYYRIENNFFYCVGEFGSERLVQKVVTQILELSKLLDAKQKQSGSSAAQVPALKVKKILL